MMALQERDANISVPVTLRASPAIKSVMDKALKRTVVGVIATLISDGLARSKCKPSISVLQNPREKRLGNIF